MKWKTEVEFIRNKKLMLNLNDIFQDQQNADDSLDASRGTPTPSSGVQHPVVSALRPTPSPVGSSGSRSNTPASLPGNYNHVTN